VEDYGDELGSLLGLSRCGLCMHSTACRVVIAGVYRVKFAPYVEDSFRAVLTLLDYPSADTRRAAVCSVSMLCRAVCKLPGRTCH